MKKKILHVVSGNLNGGAARGAYWLHKGLLKENVNSKILINSDVTRSDTTITNIEITKKDLFFYKIVGKIEQLFFKSYRKRQESIIFNLGHSGKDITKNKLYQWADIINLHWINGFVDIKQFSKIKKPIVWTLRDMWPLTGGCHYSLSCDKYKTGCGSCYQLGSNRSYDITKYIINKKRNNYPKNMKIVGISDWLSQEARKSILFEGFDIRTISNNVDCETFYPEEKNKARKILGIKTNKKLILVGAQKLTDTYKGFNSFIEAVKFLERDKYCLLFFGNLNENVATDLGFEFLSFGFISNDEKLRLLYSSADVFVAPSIMEAFGKTIVESMACGTPVVCFNATGPKSLVKHKEEGYKAIPFDVKDLSKGIVWVTNNNNDFALSEKARHAALDNFSTDVIAKQYKDLYSRM